MIVDDLARRLVAAYPDVWAAGMLGASGIRYDALDDRGRPYRAEGRGRRDEYGEPAECHVYGPRDDVPDLDDPATAGVLLARLKSMGAFVALTYGVNVDGEPVSHLRVWPDGAGLLSTPLEFDGPTLGRACAAALVALTTPTPPPTE